MKIIAIDGYALNPGDLDWTPWEALGDFEVHDRTPAGQTVTRAKDADAVLTNKVVFYRPEIEALPKLKYIGVLATGYNIIDVEAAAEHGVTVTNVPTYGTPSVAEHALALLLELTHHVGLHADAVRQGEWARCPDFCFWRTPLIELSGKTMGIIGFGRIGRHLGRIALAMDMKVLACDSVQRDPPEGNFEWASAERVFCESDVVSLHCPQTPETEGLVNKDTLALMRPAAFLINTSRGGLVVDQDLADALNQGVIAGAGLDVIAVEPPSEDNPLFKAKNCLITPHQAWASHESRARLMDTALANLNAFLDGKPQNVVNQV